MVSVEKKTGFILEDFNNRPTTMLLRELEEASGEVL